MINRTKIAKFGLAVVLLSACSSETKLLTECNPRPPKPEPEIIWEELSEVDQKAMDARYAAQLMLFYPNKNSVKAALGRLMSVQGLNHRISEVNLMTGILLEELGYPEKARKYYRREIEISQLATLDDYLFDRRIGLGKCYAEIMLGHGKQKACNSVYSPTSMNYTKMSMRQGGSSPQTKDFYLESPEVYCREDVKFIYLGPQVIHKDYRQNIYL